MQVPVACHRSTGLAAEEQMHTASVNASACSGQLNMSLPNPMKSLEPEQHRCNLTTSRRRDMKARKRPPEHHDHPCPSHFTPRIS